MVLFFLEGYVREKDADLMENNESHEKDEVRDPKFSKGQSKRIWNELYKVWRYLSTKYHAVDDETYYMKLDD